jgi:hypothetical protein
LLRCELLSNYSALTDNLKNLNLVSLDKAKSLTNFKQMN